MRLERPREKEIYMLSALINAIDIAIESCILCHDLNQMTKQTDASLQKDVYALRYNLILGLTLFV